MISFGESCVSHFVCFEKSPHEFAQASDVIAGDSIVNRGADSTNRPDEGYKQKSLPNSIQLHQPYRNNYKLIYTRKMYCMVYLTYIFNTLRDLIYLCPLRERSPWAAACEMKFASRSSFPPSPTRKTTFIRDLQQICETDLNFTVCKLSLDLFSIHLNTIF